MEAKNTFPRWLNVACSLLIFVPNAAWWYFEMAALAQYAPQQALVSMETSPDESLLPGNCSTEWHLLHKLLLLTMANFFLETLATCIFVVSNPQTKEEIEAHASSVAGKVSFVSIYGGYLLWMYQTYVWYSGFSITLFHYDLKDISHCAVLHNTAWWIFDVAYILTAVFKVAVSLLIVAKLMSAVSARNVAAPAADEEEGPGYVRIEE